MGFGSMGHTSAFLLFRRRSVSDAHYFRGSSASRALAGMSYNSGKGQLQMLLCSAQAKEFGIKEHECVQEHVGRVHAKLFTVPQMFFFHSGEYQP